MNSIYWIGPRESDISFTNNIFNGSITIYGSNKENNFSYCNNDVVRINHNSVNKEVTKYILAKELELLKKDDSCRFMFYNPNIINDLPEIIKDRSVYINDFKLMDELNRKDKFQDKFGSVVPVIERKYFKGKDCKWEALTGEEGFINAERIIVQEIISSGGEGTFLVDKNNNETVLSNLNHDTFYIVSKYINNNIPINIHCIISNDNVLLLPGSVQIVCIDSHTSKLLYRGADYCAYPEINSNTKNIFEKYVTKICSILQEDGYRGVVGIDAIITGESVFMVEINNRFQGSTGVLNKILSENALPSVQQLHMYSFDKLNYKQSDFENLNINYSFFSYINDPEGVHSHNALCEYKNCKEVDSLILDGYCEEVELEANAYKFQLLFNKNIVSVYNRQEVRLYPNIEPPLPEWYKNISDGSLIHIKTALINQGLKISDKAAKHMENNGGMRVGTYYSLDIKINDVRINCPLSIKTVRLTPFTLDCENEGLYLYYYGKKLYPVEYDKKYEYVKKKTQSGIDINSICFLATDRLRLQNSSFCTFAVKGNGCRFCEVDCTDSGFSTEDILEAIDICFSDKKVPFRHILIGGKSQNPGFEKETIIRMCRRIRTYSDMNIYLMCLPPADLNDIDEYIESGVNEFGFNIEVFNRDLAEKYMPGKGKIPIRQYMRAIEHAVSLTDKNGAVRSAFVVGLEPIEDLLKGIEEVCKIGAAPILSAFRPIPYTPMADVVPPSNNYLMEVTVKAQNICSKYGIELGPSCNECKNNTLTII